MDRRKVGEVDFDSSLIDTYISMNARFARLIVSNISPRRKERERERPGKFADN